MALISSSGSALMNAECWILQSIVLLCLLCRIRGQPALRDIGHLGYLKTSMLVCSHFVTDRSILVRLHMICMIWKVCSSQKRDNNNTIQLLTSVQEGMKAEGMKLELTVSSECFQLRAEEVHPSMSCGDAPGNLPSCTSGNPHSCFRQDLLPSGPSSCSLQKPLVRSVTPPFPALLTDHCSGKASQQRPL